MSEINKSLAFVAVAVVICGAGVWALQSGPQFDAPPAVHKEKLFPAFKDVLTAAGLDIVQYDEAAAKVKPFKVAQSKKGRWSIPSHFDYPADAKDQLAVVAAGLVDLKIVDWVGDDAGDLDQYGLIDPSDKDFKPGMRGAGMRVTLRNKDDGELVALVIGKEVSDKPGLRYVRKAGENVVYLVELATDKFSTDFGDWIEKDLLKMNTMDIKRIDIADYSVDAMLGQLLHRAEMQISYDDASESRWKLESDKSLAASGATAKLVDNKMTPDEELNTAKLDTLRSSLGNVRIVDVARKPEGLSASLKINKEVGRDMQGLQSLAKRGFYPVPGPNGQLELKSSEGEIMIGMRDGVEYLLRFGQIAESASNSSKKDKAGDKKDGKKDAAKKGKKGEKKDEADGVSRYLLVTARFNESLIPKPKLEPLPDDKKPDAAKDAAKKDDKADVKKAEREQIEKDNQRKLDDYKDKVKQGEKRVKELNERFAEWYYVISNDVYRDLHVGRTDVIKKKEAKKDGAKGAAPNSPEEFLQMKDQLPGMPGASAMPAAPKRSEATPPPPAQPPAAAPATPKEKEPAAQTPPASPPPAAQTPPPAPPAAKK